MLITDCYIEINWWGMFTRMLNDSRKRPGFIPWVDDNTPGWKER